MLIQQVHLERLHFKEQLAVAIFHSSIGSSLEVQMSMLQQRERGEELLFKQQLRKAI